MKYHGVASGVFTADAHINGSSPTQGTTLTTVCEMINTLETLAGMGEMSRDIPDILEKIAFNALPAAWSQDMRRVQGPRTGQSGAGQRRRSAPSTTLTPEALLFRAPHFLRGRAGRCPPGRSSSATSGTPLPTRACGR